MPEGLSSPLTVIGEDGRLDLDFASRTVRVDGAEVSLTPTEYDVLSLLASRCGRVVSLDDLIEAVWGDWFGPRGHVSVHIHHLRRKLGPCGPLIVTRRSVGYMLAAPAAAVADTFPASDWMSGAFLHLLERDAVARGVVWFVVDQDRRIKWVSASVVPLLGLAVEDIVGQNPWILLDSEDAEAIVGLFPLSDGESSLHLYATGRDGFGDAVEADITAHVVFDDTGARVGGLAEWRVRRLPAGRTVTLTFDAESVLLSVEPRMPFLGWDPQEIIGTYFSLAGMDPESSRRALDALVKLGEMVTLHRIPAHDARGEVHTLEGRLTLQVHEGVLQSYAGEVRLP